MKAAMITLMIVCMFGGLLLMAGLTKGFLQQATGALIRGTGYALVQEIK